MAPMKKSKCPKGKIYVRGYKTKSSRKRASHRVKGHCVTDKGLPGRSKRVLPKLKKGEFGSYSTKKAHPKRMAILKRLVTKMTFSKVLKRLVLLRTYTRRSDPKSAKKYSADIKALQKWHKSHMKAGSKKGSTKKRRVTRKKRTMKRKSAKRRSTRKVSKRTKKVTKRKSAKKAVKKAMKRRSTMKMTKRKTTTSRRRVVRRRSTVMNK